MAAIAGELDTLLGWLPVTVAIAAVIWLAAPSMACATGLVGSLS